MRCDDRCDDGDAKGRGIHQVPVPLNQPPTALVSVFRLCELNSKARQVVDFFQTSVESAGVAWSSKLKNLSGDMRFRAGVELEAIT